jgi:hypothetical protein
MSWLASSMERILSFETTSIFHSEIASYGSKREAKWP